MPNGLANGYTRIANSILDGIMMGDFSKREHILLVYTFRNGYGWRREQSACDLDTNKIAKDTGLDVSNINETFRLLESKNVLKRKNGQILFNRHIDQWKKVKTTSKAKRSEQPLSRVETTSFQGQNNLAKAHSTQPDSDLQLSKENIKIKATPLSPINGPPGDANVANQVVNKIITILNEVTGKSFRQSSKGTRRLIKARLNEDFTIEDFQRVIEVKSQQWLGDIKMERYLRPMTLFSNKFEGYLQEAHTETRTNKAFGFEDVVTSKRGYGL